MRTKLLIVLLAFSLNTSIAQDTSDVSIDFAAASPALSINLDRLPGNLVKNLFEFLPSLYEQLNNSEIEKAFNRDLKIYLRTLQDNMANNTGQLVRVQLYSNEQGTKFIAPSFLLPSGMGVDPVDAYSEHLNTPTLRASPNTSFGTINESYFLWIYKSNSQLSVSTIPREFTHSLTAKANRVAMAKAKGEVYFRPVTSEFTDFLDRATFWGNEYKRLEEKIKKQAAYEQIKKLKEDFSKLQAELSTLVQKYEDLKSKIANNESYLNTVELLLSITSGTAAAIKSYKEANPAFTSLEVCEEVASFDPNVARKQIETYKNNNEIIKQTIRGKEREIRILETNLETAFSVPGLH